MSEQKYRAGFISIVGKPNVGKSTLMNQIVGANISVVTPKAHTTRQQITGILTTTTAQLIFVDTPGWLDAKTALQKYMRGEIRHALENPDIVLWLVDATYPLPQTQEIARVQQLAPKTPLLIGLNKIDLLEDAQTLADAQKHLSQAASAPIFPISARTQKGLDPLLHTLMAKLPCHDPYFDMHALTDKSERFIAAEILRKHVLLRYRKEIPYHTRTQITAFKIQDTLLHIHAILEVERPSQRAILLGKKGKAIRMLGQSARKEMERFFGKKIFLALRIHIAKHWTKKTSLIPRV